MAGPDNDNRNRSDDRARRVQLSSDVKDKLISALVAVIVSLGGVIGYVKLNPDTVRPYPWTSLQAKADKEATLREIYAHIDLRLKPHEDHLRRADKGWEMIYEMRSDIKLIKQQLGRME